MPDLSKKNYYEIMGVSRDASTEDIKTAYKDLARIYHPDSRFYSEIIDIPPSERDVEVFKIITQAYNILVNPEKRADYDLTLEPDLGTIRSRMTNESTGVFSRPSARSPEDRSNTQLFREADRESIKSVAEMINEFHSDNSGMLPVIIKGVLFGVGMAIVMFLIIRMIS